MLKMLEDGVKQRDKYKKVHGLSCCPSMISALLRLIMASLVFDYVFFLI